MIDFLHQNNPLTHVLILGLLPRGSSPEDRFKLPSDYSRGIDAVNDQLERYAFGNKQLHFADCALPFTAGGKVRHKAATCVFTSVIVCWPAAMQLTTHSFIHSLCVFPSGQAGAVLSSSCINATHCLQHSMVNSMQTNTDWHADKALGTLSALS